MDWKCGDSFASRNVAEGAWGKGWQEDSGEEVEEGG